MCAACSSARGTRVTIIASRLVGATIRPRRSSIATPDQFDPPRFPGKTTVPLSDGGVKIGPERSDAIRARHCSRASGVTPNASAAVSPSGTRRDRKSTRLNSSHTVISYAVFCLKKKKTEKIKKRHNKHSAAESLTTSCKRSQLTVYVLG